MKSKLKRLALYITFRNASGALDATRLSTQSWLKVMSFSRSQRASSLDLVPSNIHSTWHLHANSLDLLFISLHDFKVTQRLMRNVKPKFQSCTVLDKMSFCAEREKTNQTCWFCSFLSDKKQWSAKWKHICWRKWSPTPEFIGGED